MRIAGSILALCLTACVSVPDHRVDGQHGTVLAYAPEVAREVAETLDVLAPAVRARLESPRTAPPVVHVRSSDAGPSYRGDRIELGRPLYEQEDWRFVLHHELVHWYAESTWVEGLPLVLEEGVADYLTCEAFGGLAARAEQIRARAYPTVDLVAAFEIEQDDWHRLDRPGALLHYHLGFELVQRIGLEELRELALTGEITAERLDRALDRGSTADREEGTSAAAR
jgi:hypothetical protein